MDPSTDNPLSDIFDNALDIFSPDYNLDFDLSPPLSRHLPSLKCRRLTHFQCRYHQKPYIGLQQKLRSPFRAGRPSINMLLSSDALFPCLEARRNICGFAIAIETPHHLILNTIQGSLEYVVHLVEKQGANAL